MLSIMEINNFVTDVTICLKSHKLTKSPMDSKEKEMRKVQHTRPHTCSIVYSFSLSCDSKCSPLHPLLHSVDTAVSLTVTYTRTVNIMSTELSFDWEEDDGSTGIDGSADGSANIPT